MSDLVEQLRRFGRRATVLLYDNDGVPDRNIATEAADRITQLEADRAELVEALREAREHVQAMYSGIAGGNAHAGARFASKDSVCKRIDEALAKMEARP